MDIPTWQIGIGLVIVGIFSGIGSAVGQYLFNEVLKKKIVDEVVLKIKGKEEKKE